MLTADVLNAFSVALPIPTRFSLKFSVCGVLPVLSYTGRCTGEIQYFGLLGCSTHLAPSSNS